MVLSRIGRFLATALIAAATSGARSPAQTVTVSDVVAFNAAFGTPVFIPAQGRGGLLYGVMGVNSPGYIFDFSAAGATKVIYSANPSSGYGDLFGLSLGTDGNFYGVVEETAVIGNPGYGILFRVAPNGAFTILHNFNGGTDGAFPAATPIEGTDGNLYGTTNGGCCIPSTVYKYTPAGVFSVIYTFDNAHGIWARPLMQGSDGSLYVTAWEGGVNNNGTIVKLTTSGKLLNCYAFPGGAGGNFPNGPLVEASDGNYYGTTYQGGSPGQGLGTIFQMTSGGKVTVLYAFSASANSTDGVNPAYGLVQATDGYLYGGTTRGGANGLGTVFRIGTSGAYSQLYSFSSATGSNPLGLMQDTNGLLYGTLAQSGTYGYGDIYSLSMGLGPFITFVRPSGKVGQAVQILGQSLTGTTGVTFNGIKATNFKVVGDTYMTAVVPSGATSGPVVVTTPTGNLTSNVRFRILK
jgi:uncharacterized repeat protein (TIGR03803 family)